MKVRVNIVIDYEFTDKEAHDSYGAYDPATVAAAMQAQGERELIGAFEHKQGVQHVGLTVHPLYG
jgi:hypothetical protein